MLLSQKRSDQKRPEYYPPARASIRTGVVVRVIPRVDDRDPAVFKIFGVSRGDRCAVSAGNGGDLAIGKVNGPACGLTLGKNRGEGRGGGAVEGQDAAREILGDHRIHGRLQLIAPLAFR